MIGIGALYFYLSGPEPPKKPIGTLTNDGFIEVELTGLEELTNGTVREVKTGHGQADSILLARYKGKVHAFSAFCSFSNAPLIDGILFDDKILSPIYGCAYSIQDGSVERAPAIDAIPVYNITERDGKSYVCVPQQEKRTHMPMVKRDPANKTHMVVVGGGASGLMCAETLR